MYNISSFISYRIMWALSVLNDMTSVVREVKLERKGVTFPYMSACPFANPHLLHPKSQGFALTVMTCSDVEQFGMACWGFWEVGDRAAVGRGWRSLRLSSLVSLRES